MKANRTYFFIILSSLALLTVLIIQVSWILQTARIKEELFNEKANLVLSRTAEALSSDKETFKNLEIATDPGNVHKVDSLFNHYMLVYNISIRYHFEVGPYLDQKSLFLPHDPRDNSYQTCIDDGGQNQPLLLKLVFPGKEQFILAEMGLPFITSVVLLLVVIVLFWRTTLSLMKEKRISEHTTDFLNNMTHEFKTPLTNIALAGKMIVKDAAVQREEKIRHYSAIILEENEKLHLQVEQVLSMTALERGEIPLQRTELDAHQLICDALKYISIQVENKEGKIQLELNAAAFVIMGDRTHLSNALCNLIDNALKYSKGKPELHISTTNSGSQLIITLADKGIGIEKKYQEKVFDKFFRVPTGDVHDVKGFGLGLAYIRTIIELHCGRIALQSEKEKGTTFIITLPHV